MFALSLLLTAAHAAPCAPPELGELEQQIASKALRDDLDGARSLFEEGVAGLPCLEVVVEPRALAGIWLASAATELYAGDEAAAAAASLQAAAIDPLYFNPRLGEALRATWAAQVAQLEFDGGVTLRLHEAGLSAFVDGGAVEAGEIPLVSGPRLVQIARDGVVIYGQTVVVEAGTFAPLETGLEALPEPDSAAPVAGRTRRMPPPLLLGAGAAALAAGGSWVMAGDRQRQSQESTDLAEVDADFSAARTWSAVGFSLAGTAGACVALHVALR
jgi:hypothetical protein